jgi:hypothetical protein
MAQIAHIQLCAAKGTAGDKLRIPSWIEIQLIGEDDKPIPNIEYNLMLPGGTLRSGKLDDNGCTRVDNLPPGQCQVSFPSLDQEAWTTVDSQSQQTGTTQQSGQAA